eukprot:CAMPEP_0170424616 /NCGR_PEP_ID=MMETSP0117_2-20130122/37653_1 /TAXON_ID=400756 /ORGANISM="Durinskia baltica, Strain CSIRO CS-38" /LENGTH=56 /DNA_ID=CAMNT_0010683497 /DNA_START=36 /DNA_END=202 /DNA_ORIENTATION=-
MTRSTASKAQAASQQKKSDPAKAQNTSTIKSNSFSSRKRKTPESYADPDSDSEDET